MTIVKIYKQEVSRPSQTAIHRTGHARTHHVVCEPAYLSIQVHVYILNHV